MVARSYSLLFQLPYNSPVPLLPQSSPFRVCPQHRPLACSLSPACAPLSWQLPTHRGARGNCMVTVVVMGYWCWCQHICCSSLSVLLLMKNEHYLHSEQVLTAVEGGALLFEGSPV